MLSYPSLSLQGTEVVDLVVHASVYSPLGWLNLVLRWLAIVCKLHVMCDPGSSHLKMSIKLYHVSICTLMYILLPFIAATRIEKFDKYVLASTAMESNLCASSN